MMQKEFRTPYFLIPEVVRIERDMFSMREIKGATNAAVYLSSLTNKQIDNEVETYVNFISNNITGVGWFKQSPFLRKILQIINRLHTVEDIRLCERVAVDLKPEYRLFLGRYHGDFTLCNILYPGRYLIDFTPSYIDSPVMDVVKLKQEHKVSWSKLLNNIPDENYDRICHSIERCLGHYFKEDTRTLEAMNLLRILPYAKTKDMSKLLRKKINELL